MKLKRMVLTLDTCPFINYSVELDQINIGEHEKHVYECYEDTKSIFINDINGREFYILLYLNNDITNERLRDVEQLAKNALIKYLNDRIKDYTTYVMKIEEAYI